MAGRQCGRGRVWQAGSVAGGECVPLMAEPPRRLMAGRECTVPLKQPGRVSRVFMRVPVLCTTARRPHRQLARASCVLRAARRLLLYECALVRERECRRHARFFLVCIKYRSI